MGLLGKVVFPEDIGRLIDWIRGVSAPRDPVRPPEILFAHPGMDDFNSYYLYRGWMKQYLRYLQWYCTVALAPDVTIDALLDPPIFTRTWYIPETDNDCFKFGLAFRAFDKLVMLMKNRVKCISRLCDMSVIYDRFDVIYLGPLQSYQLHGLK